MIKENYSFEDLVKVVGILRGENGCPWDIEQTHESIKKNLVEESYELVEAIDTGIGEKIADESGDLLLQVIFHAQIGAEENEYDINDVINAVCKKLIHRHPHVFGDAKVENSEEVLNNWDKIKRTDRKQETITEELKGISKYLPTLMRAEKVQKKVSKTGYLFNGVDLISENIKNMLGAIAAGCDENTAEKYLGKALFDVVSVCRAVDVDPEIALNRKINEFIDEFSSFENKDKGDKL